MRLGHGTVIRRPALGGLMLIAGAVRVRLVRHDKALLSDRSARLRLSLGPWLLVVTRSVYAQP